MFRWRRNVGAAVRGQEQLATFRRPTDGSTDFSMTRSARHLTIMHLVSPSSQHSKSLSPALRRAYSSKKRFPVLGGSDSFGAQERSADKVRQFHRGAAFFRGARQTSARLIAASGVASTAASASSRRPSCSPGKRKARAHFAARLRRALQRVPEAILTPLVKSMGRRCKALQRVKGKDFEERCPARPARLPTPRTRGLPLAARRRGHGEHAKFMPSRRGGAPGLRASRPPAV